MKRQGWRDVLVLAAMVAALWLVCQALPAQIPFHLNARGEADVWGSKYLLLLGAVIPYSAYWRWFRKKR